VNSKRMKISPFLTAIAVAKKAKKSAKKPEKQIEQSRFDSPNCGESFTNVEAVRILSPGHPDFYEHNLRCLWTIKNACATSFTVSAVEFSVEDTSPTCGWDSLKIFAPGAETKFAYCGGEAGFWSDSFSSSYRKRRSSDRVYYGSDYDNKYSENYVYYTSLSDSSSDYDDKPSGKPDYTDENDIYFNDGIPGPVTIQTNELHLRFFTDEFNSFGHEYKGFDLQVTANTKEGFETMNGSCVDINECSIGTDNCAATVETCVNTEGSFDCHCSFGYRRDGSGTCVDFDECLEETDTCEDIIETCSNTAGSFNCPCSSGYGRGADGVCGDIDECAVGSHTCAATIETCVNNVGSFDCPCSDGYERDSSGRCVDIDECARGTHTCAAVIETCVNSVGSFDCPCSNGYERDSDNVCVDIDECAIGSHTCAVVIETCVNSAGSFDCPCSDGYERVDGVCVDIDECARELDNCHDEKDRCDNFPGSYVCFRLPMHYEESITVTKDWIDMTSAVLELANHDRAGKFDNRVHKLLRNALESYNADCSKPYNSDKFEKNDFAVWEKYASRSDNVCDQATIVKAGLSAWVDNYACMDKNNKRQTKRVSKFIEKITNPYC